MIRVCRKLFNSESLIESAHRAAERRQIVAPGVSPGSQTPNASKPAKRATEVLISPILNRAFFRPYGALRILVTPLPRAYARGYQYAACFAGWLSVQSRRAALHTE